MPDVNTPENQRKINATIREQKSAQFDVDTRTSRLVSLATNLWKVASSNAPKLPEPPETPAIVISPRFLDTLHEAEIALKRAQARWLADNERKS